MIGLTTALGAAAANTFNGSTNLLTLDTVTLDGTTYTNVTATVSAYALLGVGSGSAGPTSFDPATGVLTLGSVSYADTTYTNVTVRIDAYVLLGATAPGSSGTDPTCGLGDFQSALLARINAERAAGATCGSKFYGPAQALQWSSALANAASVHSQDMATNTFFSHTGSDGSNAGQRITAQGYQWSTWAENIAAGQPSVTSVMDAWMNSTGHCENIMSQYIQEVGVACIAGPAGGYSTYWTMNLASH
jgi:uncharacterized protein YkwD